MADLTGDELVARVLAREGVGAIFTLCGGHILPIYDACLRHGIRVIDVRHEQAAAHAAMVASGPSRRRCRSPATIALSRALGEVESIEDPRCLRPALERALGSGRVACLNVILDPDAYRREGGGSLAI